MCLSFYVHRYQQLQHLLPLIVKQRVYTAVHKVFTSANCQHILAVSRFAHSPGFLLTQSIIPCESACKLKLLLEEVTWPLEISWSALLLLLVMDGGC